MKEIIIKQKETRKVKIGKKTKKKTNRFEKCRRNFKRWSSVTQLLFTIQFSFFCSLDSTDSKH